MLDKINVLFDTSPLSNANQVRGVGTYTRQLAQELEKLPQIRLERSTHRTSQNFNPDIIHYPYFDLFFSTLPIVKKAKTIVTIHDLIPLIFSEHYPVGVRGSINWKKQRLALSTVKAIITDSQASKADIIRLLGFDEGKVGVAYLAGNPKIKPVNQTQVQKVRKMLKLPKNYILYVGDINYNKNLVQLIKAMKYLPERVHLVLLGKNFKESQIPEWQWISTQISLSNVEKKIHFISDLGVGDIQLVNAIFSGAVCYVQASLYEGFGLPVLEAMQAGTPVVCTHNSSLIEIGGKHVVFVDESAEGIAEGVKQVISWDDEKRIDVINNALAWSTNFTWQKTAYETAKVYEQVVNG